MNKPIGNGLSSPGKLFLTVIGYMALTVPLLIGALAAPSGLAQTQDGSRPSFDVISIKPTERCIEITEEAPGRIRAVALSPRFQPGRFSGCSSLKGLIAMAYQVDANDIAGGPGWIESANYRIEAKAEGETDTEVLRLMLQSLLQERFGLEFHHETREKEVYALQVVEGGHKLRQAVDESGNPIDSLPDPEAEREKIEEALRKGEEPPKGGTRVIGKRSPDGSILQEFSMYAVDMERFARQLQGMVGRKVIDKTGLTGVYDIKMEIAPAQMMGAGGLMRTLPPGASPPPPGGTQSANGSTPAPLSTPSGGPSVFTALKEQLGLKLESDEAPLEHIVIDRVEKPSEN